MKVAIEASTSSTYMPAAPMAARCHLLGSIHESETLQYRQGVSTRIMMPISWHSPPKCLHDSPWPNSCRTLVTARVAASRKALAGLKKSWKVGSLARNVSNSTRTSTSAASISSQAGGQGQRREEPPHQRIEPVEEALRIEALEADAEDVRQGAEQQLASSLAAALEELSPWPGTSASTSPLRCSIPRKFCSSSSVIFCGGNSSSNRSLISSRLVWPSSICRMAYSSSWKRK